MFKLFSRTALTAAAGLALSLPLLKPQPATAQFLPPGADTQVIENLAEIPNIPIEDFPDILLTQEILDQFAATGTPLPEELEPGQLIAAEDLFRVGHLEPFGLPDASLEDLSKATGVSIRKLDMADLDEFFELVTIEGLLGAENLNFELADLDIVKAPALKAIFLQTLFDRLRLKDRRSLQRLHDLFENRGGNLSLLISHLSAGLGAGDYLDLDDLPPDLNPNLGLEDGIFAPEIPDSVVDRALGRLDVGDLARYFPVMTEMPLNNLSPELLENLSIRESVPDLSTLAIGRIEGIEQLSLSSFGELNVQSLSLGQMPDPMRLVGGVRFGIADVALGEPDSGSHEQRRMRVVSGGITSKRKKLTARRCTGSECPHFEISDPSNPAYNGAAWMDGQTKVPDGFGPLCKPFRCKGPAGNHPFGSGVRVQLREIDQAAGTAQVTLSFAYCRRILFIGRTCTPWVFPIPSGIPIGSIAEETIVPYSPPSKVK